MGHMTCCVVNCKNNGVNSSYKFYSFPAAKSKINQRLKWISAVKRKNLDGSQWKPKRTDYICSAHFIGNQKSNDPLNPSYIPMIFPSAYRVRAVNESSKINRHLRFLERRKEQSNFADIDKQQFVDKVKKKMTSKVNTRPKVILCEEINDTPQHETVSRTTIEYADKQCQADIFCTSSSPQKTFICNRYIYNTSHVDAETQTEIISQEGVNHSTIGRSR